MPVLKNDSESHQPGRRRFLRNSGMTAVAASSAPLIITACGGQNNNSIAFPVQQPPLELAGDTPVVLTEGTNLAASVSPDGKTIAMDLQGILWILPVTGGEARQLTGYFDDVALPHWSPDGKVIAFQSYRSGNFHIWTINADGSDLRQLTDGPYDHREPKFAPGGQEIVCSSDRSGSYGIYAVDLGSKAVRLVADTAGEDAAPAWSPDGTQIAFVSGQNIMVVPAGGNSAPQAVVTAGTYAAPTWTRDGRGLVYTASLNGQTRLMRSGSTIGPAGEDVFTFPVSWLSDSEFLYTADGQIKRLSTSGTSSTVIPFSAKAMVAAPLTYQKRKRDFDSTQPRPVKGIASPQISPDGQRAAFVALNQVWVVDLGNGKLTQITQDGYYKCHPTWSSDGSRLLYSTDQTGKFELWEQEVDSGSKRQVTNGPLPLVSPRYSPDGARIACLDNSGNVYIVDTATGAPRKLIGPLFTPGRPTWSPDGATVALSAIKPYSARYREGISVVLTVNVNSGAAKYEAAIPDRSMGPRGDDGPVWTRSGKLVFAMQSTLWTMSVDATGSQTAAPTRINNEVTDAVSVSATGERILYLSNGVLRLTTVGGVSPTSVPMSMTWTLSKPTGTTVVRAGKLWDGRSSTLSTDMDVVIVGNRIQSVEPHSARTGVTWVDASAYTVMPGLMEMHAHIQGKHFNTALGDREGRMFLSFGITTTRGLAELAYHSAEHKEAVDSGARVAPRHFATGEAMDGSKIYYDVMRAIYDDAQLELELQRAKALDYDLLKCYVRMPLRWQKRVIEFGHQNHIPCTSHYLFPWVAFGGDGQEHMGATSRFGYSRTVGPTGKTYQDVQAFYGASHASRTPTIFGINGFLAETPSTVDEARMRVLWPTWQYNAIAASFKGTPMSMNSTLLNNVAGVRSLMAAGAKMMQGTDFYIVSPAVTLHLNLRVMVKGGMSALDALKTATSIPGDFLQQGHGAIEAGALADLSFVSGDPLQRIEDAANVKGVVANGRYYSQDDLIAPFVGKAGNPTASAVGLAAVQRSKRTHAVAKSSTKAFAEAVARNDYWWHNEEFVIETMKSCCVQV